MKRARKMKVLWLSLGISSAVSAAVGTAALVWLLLSGQYVWAAVVGAITVHGFYGIPFYFAAMAGTRVDLALLSAVEGGTLSVQGISDATGYTEAAVKDRLAVCIRRGYITGYTLSDTGLDVVN